MSKYFIPRDDELYHYGILGMKWGVRRYENPDGTLTPLGRDHYAKKAQKEYIKYKGGRRKLKKYLNGMQTSGKLRSDVSVNDWSRTIAYDMVDHGYRGNNYKNVPTEYVYVIKANNQRDKRNNYNKPGWLDGRFNQNVNLKDSARAFKSGVKYSNTMLKKKLKGGH